MAMVIKGSSLRFLNKNASRMNFVQKNHDKHTCSVLRMKHHVRAWSIPKFNPGLKHLNSGGFLKKSSSFMTYACELRNILKASIKIF